MIVQRRVEFNAKETRSLESTTMQAHLNLENVSTASRIHGGIRKNSTIRNFEIVDKPTRFSQLLIKVCSSSVLKQENIVDVPHSMV